MKSRVYFIPVNNTDDQQAINQKLKYLIDESNVLDFIQKKDKIILKLHFGEEGNTGFVRPEHVGVIAREATAKGAEVLLSDANTLYRGRRLNSCQHRQLAYEHGFTKEATGADVFIPDDDQDGNTAYLEINQKFIKGAKVARIFIENDGLIVVSHFKGHALTGFGGALKNVGMGCATRQGKLAQHCNVAPVVHIDNCIGCGECKKICPVGAIKLVNKKSVVDSLKCIGCASCLAACPTMAMFIDFKAGSQVQDKMVEYCLAVLKDKKNKSGFINFAIKINKECDCWGMENPRIAPDVGILASADPVSVDRASLDLVNRASGKDIFKDVHPDQDATIQLRYAQDIGLGSLDYELITL
ncbi:MAG TPA: DUF362 domain-containing protein [Candidatus Omnitrophota bacterium]|nr:DUF362 domain-containing protein [Candidatus Omnitrophota bacterium]HPT39363.1 DUF362 domain-containing protein [Candidatus Omnitrophota bacterium]